MPEARRIFPLMTVRENLLMGAYSRSDRKAVAADLDRMLTLFPASQSASISALASYQAASSKCSPWRAR